MKSLSCQDKQGLIDFIHDSTRCNTKDEFVETINRLKEIVPFEYATFVLRQSSFLTGESVDEIINVNYSQEWLEHYIRNNFQFIDPIIINNFTNFEIQYWDDTYERFPPPKKFIESSRSFGLSTGYTHGARNADGKEASLFSVAGQTIERNRRTVDILECTMPHLHQALSRVASTIPFKKKVFLTPREEEILKWVAHGKSSWDISIILGISERTINFHVNSFMQKLNAVTRAHAVAIAFDMKLICVD